MSRTLQKLEAGRDETFGSIIPTQKPLALNKDEDIVSVPALRIQDKRINQSFKYMDDGAPV